MRFNLQKYLSRLQSAILIYNTESEMQKGILLDAISKNQKWTFTQLNTYHDFLLFMAAHPQSLRQSAEIEKELRRISKFLSVNKSKLDESYNDSGLPFTKMNTRFSHDLLKWASAQSFCQISMDRFEEGAQELNALLNLTLPSVERSETTAGLANEELLDVLRVKKNSRLLFLLNEFSNLDDKPLVKDFLWESMKLWVHIDSIQNSFSRAFNRLKVKKIFIQEEIIKKFDHETLMKKPIPKAIPLSIHQSGNIANVIKSSLLLTMRETDPSTYMDESSLRFYLLERGISIAIYGMKASRQLPLQSYIGYTLFKNGYPAAYGGSWVFGKSAQFGLNIFEPFRGGESGYMMCQLLRVYKQVFQLESIEVDAYQFGRDNMDGIHSGAFWFYYRFGFLPIDKHLQALATKEAHKIRSTPGYRTAVNTLIRFTESNLILKFENSKPLDYATVYAKISKWIQKNYQSDRKAATAVSNKKFLQKVKQPMQFNGTEIETLNEVALMYYAMGLNKGKQIDILSKMIQTKPLNPYDYNNLLIELFA